MGGVEGSPVVCKDIFCLEGKYNLCTKLKNKLGERSATRFRLCKSMFVGVYLDDVVALVALPWGVFTVSVGKEVLTRTSGSCLINFGIFHFDKMPKRKKKLKRASNPLATLKLQSFKPLRGSCCLDRWYHCHNHMNRSKSILFLLIDATSTRMACR
jgi:hypothetical protein